MTQPGRILLVDNLLGCAEEEDWGTKKDSQSTAEPQFKDATIEEEEKDEEEVADEPPTEEPGEDTIDPRSQDMVQIHAGKDDLQ